MGGRPGPAARSVMARSLLGRSFKSVGVAGGSAVSVHEESARRGCWQSSAPRRRPGSAGAHRRARALFAVRRFQYDESSHSNRGGRSWIEQHRLTAVLADGTRYGIYRSIVERPHDEVTVAAVATRFGLHPNVARMHLTKLAQAGLLATSLRKDGSGGRPARLYRLSDKVSSLTMPPRRYDLLADLALKALAETGDLDTRRRRVPHLRRAPAAPTSPTTPSFGAAGATSSSGPCSRWAKRSACCPR